MCCCLEGYSVRHLCDRTASCCWLDEEKEREREIKKNQQSMIVSTNYEFCFVNIWLDC